jgi:hypothetical protein
MLNSKRKRLVFLMAAGVLFGVTAFGWLQRISTNRTTSAEPAHPVAATVVQPAATTATQSALADTKAQPAPGQNVQTATASSNGAAAAPLPESARTPNYDQQPIAPESQAYLRRPLMRATRWSQARQGGSVLPPPPPEAAYEIAPEEQSPVPPPMVLPPLPMKRLSMTEAVTLVGLVDGKAIFSVPKGYAREQNISQAFTLGVGQRYNGIKVESVSDKSVTISDGKTICVKDIGPIN